MEDFGDIHKSLVTCEWCKAPLWRIGASKIFRPGEVLSPGVVVESVFVKYIGQCSQCGDVWSQNITPAMAAKAREQFTSPASTHPEALTHHD